MKVIADTGMEEILILTGESRNIQTLNTLVNQLRLQENISRISA